MSKIKSIEHIMLYNNKKLEETGHCDVIAETYYVTYESGYSDEFFSFSALPKNVRKIIMYYYTYDFIKRETTIYYFNDAIRNTIYESIE